MGWDTLHSFISSSQLHSSYRVTDASQHNSCAGRYFYCFFLSALLCFGTHLKAWQSRGRTWHGHVRRSSASFRRDYGRLPRPPARICQAHVLNVPSRISQGPLYTVPVVQFVDENCLIFDDEEENKLEFTLVWLAIPHVWQSRAGDHACEGECTRFSTRDLRTTLQVHEKFKVLVDDLLGGARQSAVRLNIYIYIINLFSCEPFSLKTSATCALYEYIMHITSMFTRCGSMQDFSKNSVWNRTLS